MNARLAELEAHCSQLKTLMSSSRQPEHLHSPEEDMPHGEDSGTADQSLSTDAVYPDEPSHPGLHHSYHIYHQQQQNEHPQDVEQEASLNSAIPPPLAHDLAPQHPSTDAPGNLDADVATILESLGRPDHDIARGLSASGEGRVDLARAHEKVCRDNGAHFRPAFDIFFRLLNPLHPILNETQFHSQFDTLVFDQGDGLNSVNRTQTLALVLLIFAEVSMLNRDSPDPEQPCGWDEFCSAESILAEFIWKDSANILTVQCLLLKTRYLSYLQRLHQARDTMAIAVRISLMIGLHDQSRWVLQGADAFEIAMRQRVFWCLFTLERSVSLNCGMPPTMRASDCLVDLPPLLDDRSMAPFRPLPGETPQLSSMPYLRLLISWGELWGEIWESMFSVRAFLSGTAELVTVLDAKILKALQEAPPHLQWQGTGEGERLGQHYTEPWILRQQVMYTTVSS